MARRFFTPLLLTFVFSAGLRTDLPGPRFSYDIRVCVENLDDYPNYSFFLKYNLTRGNPFVGGKLTKLESGKLTRLEGTGDRLSSVYLVAVPHGQALPATEKRTKWVDAKPENALQSQPMRISGSDSGCELTFRVRIVGDTVHTELIESIDRTARFLWMSAGVALSVIACSAGIVVIAKRRRRAAWEAEMKALENRLPAVPP